ncbi:MAG: hypothetical protein AMXMBFR80_04700 [Dehalococcoidia bacterium]|nr:hypothetical protein [Tepidiformaceae bacterium]
MIQTIVFFVVLGFPFIIYLVNALLAQREQRGIAAGIPKPKEAKPPRSRGRARPAKVRSARVTSCGRHFSHLMLDLVGSSQSCRYCTYITEVPPAGPAPGDDDERDAAIRAAEEIIDQAKH